MEGLKKVGKFLRNCVELYIPIASFLIMFSVFVIQIVARYVFNSPVQWAYEVTVMGYLWMVVLGACYAYRDRSHVTFTLIYDKLPVKGKAVCAFLGNLLMAVAFAVMFMPGVQDDRSDEDSGDERAEDRSEYSLQSVYCIYDYYPDLYYQRYDP